MPVTTFNVVHHDGAVIVTIDGDYATLKVDNVNDYHILAIAIRKAWDAGARRGVMFTGDVVNDDEARKDLKRSQRKTTWLGGVVTLLGDTGEYPRFRIDWEVFPEITEKGKP